MYKNPTFTISARPDSVILRPTLFNGSCVIQKGKDLEAFIVELDKLRAALAAGDNAPSSPSSPSSPALPPASPATPIGPSSPVG